MSKTVTTKFDGTNPPAQPARLSVFAGLFFLTLATLMYELLLTRIFSVLTRYHFAFMAVSIGMLGGTAGALAVYLLPNLFRQWRAPRQMGICSILFGLSVVVAILSLASIPFTFDTHVLTRSGYKFLNAFAIILVYSIVAVPFYFSGVAVTLALTRFPKQVSRLYAADLVGAALGCIAILAALKNMDGPTSLVATGSLGVLAGALFFFAARPRILAWVALAFTICMAAFTYHLDERSDDGWPMIPLKWIKGNEAQEVLYEKWNPYSRVTIGGFPDLLQKPSGWGLSQKYKGPDVRFLRLWYDADASTDLLHFNGDTSSVEFLKWDIVNAAHELRDDAEVLVIGAGGGRDILSALVYGQKHVTGVEINDATIEALKGPYADYTGQLARHPKVDLVVDEARSFTTRSKKSFDIIQISLIDTWAASTAGAYVLTENSLYTLEAWQTFLDKMNPGGILCVSRWYNVKSPIEAYRTVSLAAAALKANGVEDPTKYIIGLKLPSASWPVVTATIMVSNQPYSDEDIRKAEAFAERTGFEVFLRPDETSPDPILVAMVEGRAKEIEKEKPVRLTAPTDDSPFFFNYVKFSNILNPQVWQDEVLTFNLKATMILGYLLAGVTAAVLIIIVLPLIATGTGGTKKGFWPTLAFFGFIGLGFMLVEISQMQRLIVFLGHPIYGLGVVLFSLLLSSGIGSFASQAFKSAGSRRGVMLFLLIVLVAFGIITLWLTDYFRASSNAVRIAVAVLMLAPPGFFLGMCFPFGIQLAADRSPKITAWMWGMNGAAGVLASVLSITISLFVGISAAYWTGFVCYVMAVLLYTFLSRQSERDGKIEEFDPEPIPSNGTLPSTH